MVRGHRLIIDPLELSLLRRASSKPVPGSRHTPTDLWESPLILGILTQRPRRHVTQITLHAANFFFILHKFHVTVPLHPPLHHFLV